MKSKIPIKQKLKKQSLKSEESEIKNKLTLFDHVKHIREIQDPEYYNNLSEENRKTFNHFMLLRALSMNNEIVQEMAFLYRYFHLIPSPQFYKVLTSLVPISNRWVPWVKTKVIKHSQELLTLVANHYSVSKRQANEYVNVLLSSDGGLERLVDLCQSTGLNDNEIEKLFDNKEK